MYISASRQHALRAVFGLLAEDMGEREIRERLGWQLLALLRADQFASFVWETDAQGTGGFGRRVALNMDDVNLDRYAAWYQYHDPITFKLQSCRHATRVTEVMPQRELMRTEFFNDFLARDGLYWGMNLHAFDGAQALGDLRIWRSRSHGDFDAEDKALLDLLEPAFAGALRRARHQHTTAPVPDASSTQAPLADKGAWALLSAREREVAQCVCNGMTDKQIAQRLNIGAPTVRTYLARIFDKLQIERRSALARWVH
jgi:DNA-binding CsgD family transcriptional regulator